MRPNRATPIFLLRTGWSELMKRALTSIVGLMLMLVALGVSAQAQDLRQLDEFAGTNCEDEMAHLDNFAIQLQQAPTMKGVIIFYGGGVRGRLPKRGEAAARAGRSQPLLGDPGRRP